MASSYRSIEATSVQLSFGRVATCDDEDLATRMSARRVARIAVPVSGRRSRLQRPPTRPHRHRFARRVKRCVGSLALPLRAQRAELEYFWGAAAGWTVEASLETWCLLVWLRDMNRRESDGSRESVFPILPITAGQ
jgi:hypothetical protein